MDDSKTITDMLYSYAGIDDFTISKINCLKHPHTDVYHIYFENGTNFKFYIKNDTDIVDLVTDIYHRYLDESNVLGMGSI